VHDSITVHRNLIISILGEQIGDSFFDGIDNITCCTGQGTGNYLMFIFFLDLQGEITLTDRATEDVK